ncbi:hypothetical protein QQZ08_007059 [Neonectria magnoliae]|uniref:Esterase-like protein n=1 Tax=Neonectria magnoliae TaxID=2732573 RepID=A0ABR1HZP2_9HYPO
MKRCTAVCSGRLRVVVQPRRWGSYDKSALTKEALIQQVESQLGHDVEGKPLRIDPDAKTITTAVGSLPISPIMDPAWMKARRKQRKSEPGKISGQFRKKLSNNPFAQAMMSPLRKCSNTESYLPRYFLQDFELVRHPEKPEQAWWAPGPFAFDSVVPVYTPGPWSPTGQTEPKTTDGDKNHPHSESAANEQAKDLDTPAPNASIATPEVAKKAPIQAERRRQAPLTSYCLSRMAVVDAMAGRPAGSKKKQNRAYVNRLLALRNGMAASTVSFGTTIYRSDMADFVLKQQRRTAVDALIYRANRSTSPDFRFLQSAAGWDAVKDIKKAGCVLWLSDKVDPVADSFATLDVEGVNYWSKLPVHNLTWLLGEEEVQRLRDSSEIFRDSKHVVLKLWRSESMRKLHLLLWRLQGYQAQMQRRDEDEDEDEDE